MTTSYSSSKIKLAISLILWGGLLSYIFQPLVHGNQDAINLIVTVFSILAGFLIAVITFIGDPKSLPSGSWRAAELGSVNVYRRLQRHKLLFKSYLVVLILIFISLLLKKQHSTIQIVLEYVFMFFSAISCILSFALPTKLMELQKERIEQEIEERKKREIEHP